MPELIDHFDHGISAIDTHYVRPGLDASHLIVDAGRAAFVDTGSSHSVPHLLAALDELNIRRDQVDYVLLTHVHLDHAGGAGALMQALPNARAVIHPRGVRHLVDPQKLIAGSIAVYGEERFKKLYGEIVPIAEDRVIVGEEGQRVSVGNRQLELLHTPGHALHHYCIFDPTARAIFSGDTFGISYREFDTAQGAFIFPTTTPVHFDPVALHASIDRLVALQPRAIYLTHYAEVREIQRLAADLHQAIDAFVDIAKRNQAREGRSARIREEMFAWLQQGLRNHGVTFTDEELHASLDTDIDLNSQGLEFWLDHQ